VIISALFFAGVHFNPAQMPHAFIVGCLLGWLFVRSNSIVPGFILHWINNSAAYVAVKMFPHMPMDAPLVSYFGSTAAVVQAVVCSLMIALPALYQLNRVLKK
ncbi:MAG: CPBP family intramembrane metalloprotease, partial [Prevotella sp.]|nr:CPBP family intramembrane metalloprotease [Prevotella sp.]